METTEKARNNCQTMEQMPEEETRQLIPELSPEGFSKEDEDFLSGLNPEERECLEYLLQTINTLDKEILGDDERNHEKMEGSPGSQDPCQHSVICSMQQPSKFEEAAPLKPGPCPAVSKSKMTKSLSEESDEVTSRRWSDLCCPQAKLPPRSANSHPTRFKKFDTILKSGVNVQELRSRFLLHLDISAPVKEPAKDTVRLIKPAGLSSNAQRSTRDEALQKLGFLQKNTPFLDADRHIQLPCAERPNEEATAGSTYTIKKSP
ncbi:uncharacterized protein LOC134489031 [Candoia aspera]|uniref:uncharacterized protein LOC134489031 n=1 Tax=Candoia aspera TaxID=51853 RepID=UPI002FD85AA9